jgi:hypothetical protein
MNHLAPGVQVHGANIPRQTTEWEDILVKRGIIQQDPTLVRHQQMVEEASKRTEQTQTSMVEKAATAKTLEELNKLEDEGLNDDDDEKVLQMFREARIKQLKEEAAKARFGQVDRLSRDEFISRVTQASQTGSITGGGPMSVVLELYKPHIEISTWVSECMNQLAKANPDVCMVRMISDQCIENWPDANVPSIFVYYDGKLFGQLIGGKECGMGNVDILQAALRVLKVPLKHRAMDENKDDDDADNKEFNGVRRIAIRQLNHDSTTNKHNHNNQDDDDDDKDW